MVALNLVIQASEPNSPPPPRPDRVKTNMDMDVFVSIPVSVFVGNSSKITMFGVDRSSFNNDKGRAKARDTATSMNMAVDLDTDLTYEDTTEEAVVVVSPLSALISDQMERWKSLESRPKVCQKSVHMSSVS